MVAGIPDLRLRSDPYIEIEEDRDKARRLAEQAGSLDLPGLVDLYFSLTPEVPPRFADRYLRGMLQLGPARAADRLEALEVEVPKLAGPLRIVDVGCGAGAWMPELARRASSLVGVDVGLRWLVVGRKALEQADVAAHLVCANAEALPLAPCSADLLVGANVLEHTSDARAALDEGFRVLDRDGVAYLTTPNRYSLLPEPHVGIPGLGLLPRTAADELVRTLRGVPYGGITLRGAAGWRDLVTRAGFRRAVVRGGQLGRRERATLPRSARAAARVLAQGRRLPGAGLALQTLGPTLEVLAFKGPNRERIPVGRESLTKML